MKKIIVKQKENEDVKLARAIIKNLTMVLGNKFTYIVRSSPEVTFDIDEKGISLKMITFKSPDEDDFIYVTNENIIVDLGGGDTQILAEVCGFEAFVEIEERHLFKIEDNINRYIAIRNSIFRKI